MRLRFHIIYRLSIVLAVVGAMAASGLAHRYSTFELDPDAQLFLLAGGTIADLCSDGEGTGHDGPDCEACRLNASADFAEPADLGAPLLLVVSTLPLLTGAAYAPFASLDWTHAARAPPVVG
jgi:hypothetical protein